MFWKSIRLVLLFLAAVVALAVVAGLTFFYSPGMQKWLFVTVLERQPDVSVQVESVRFSVGRIEARELFILRGVQGVSLGKADVRIALWPLLRRSEIVIRDGVVRDLLVDASRPFPVPLAFERLDDRGGSKVPDPTVRQDPRPPRSPPIDSPAAVDPEPAPGPEWLAEAIAPLRNLPLRLRIDHLESNGTVLLPGGERLRFAFVVDDLRPGAAGDTVFELQVQSGPAMADLYSEVRVKGSARMHQAAAGGFERIESELSASLSGSQWAADAKAWTDLAVTVMPAGDGAPIRFDGAWEISGLGDGSVALAGSARGEIAGNGVMALTVPALLTGERGESDVVVAGTVGWFEDPIGFSLEVDGERVYLEDVEALLAALAPGEAAPPVVTTPAPTPAPPDRRTPRRPSPPPETPPAPRDPTARSTVPPALPVWSGWEGDAAVRLDSVRYANQAAHNVQADVAVRGDAVRLARLFFDLEGQPVEASGVLAFDVTEAAPYRLAGDISAEGFDAGAFLRDREPGAPPLVEGVFSVRGTVSGVGADPLGVADAITGVLRIDGAHGRVRLIAPEDARVKAGLTIAGIASQFLGGRGAVEAAARLAEELQEVPYDRLEVHVVREPDLDFDLRRMAVIGPVVALHGSGIIRYREGWPIPVQPLEAALQIAVPEESAIARQLEQLKLLSGERGDDGLLLGPEFRVSGSLGAWRTNLMEILTQALTRHMGGERP